MHKVNKTQLILNHLQSFGSITAAQASRLYGVLRLSAVIFCLRKKYDIESVWDSGKDRYQNDVRYVHYTYKGEKK